MNLDFQNLKAFFSGRLLTKNKSKRIFLQLYLQVVGRELFAKTVKTYPTVMWPLLPITRKDGKIVILQISLGAWSVGWSVGWLVD